jgi:hypothetical protein
MYMCVLLYVSVVGLISLFWRGEWTINKQYLENAHKHRSCCIEVTPHIKLREGTTQNGYNKPVRKPTRTCLIFVMSCLICKTFSALPALTFFDLCSVGHNRIYTLYLTDFPAIFTVCSTYYVHCINTSIYVTVKTHKYMAHPRRVR